MAKKKSKRRAKGTGGIVKYPSGTYAFQYKNASGKTKTASLKTKNRGEAEDRAAEFAKMLTAGDTAEAVFQIARHRDLVHTKSLPFAEVWTEFLKTNPTAGDGTLDLYERALKKFVDWMLINRPAIDDFSEVDIQTARAYMEDYWSTGFSASAYNDRRNALGHITKRLANRYHIDVNPWERTERKKGVQQKRLPLSREKVIALMKKLNEVELPYSVEMRCLIMLGLYAGMRLGDAVLLEKQCINMRAGRIDYTPSKTESTSGVQAQVPILPQLEDAIRALPRHKGNYLLPQVAEHFKRNSEYIKRPLIGLIHKVTGDAKQKVKSQHKRDRSLYGFHSLRHTFCSEVARCGVSAIHLSLMTGDTITTLQKYYLKIGLNEPHVQGFESIARLLESKPVNGDREREELRKLSDDLPIEKVRELIKLARAKDVKEDTTAKELQEQQAE